MSTLAEVQSQFLSLLARDDCSADLALTFITQAMQRIQRVARLPSMERLVVYQVTGKPMSYIPVPNDLIQPKDLFVTMPTGYVTGATSSNPVTYQQSSNVTVSGPLAALNLMSYRQLLEISPLYLPTAYARLESTFQIRGSVLIGSTVELSYYGAFSDMPTLSDSNEITASSPDLVIYGALSLAGDYFSHPRTDSWEARYEAYLAEVEQMAEDVDSHGGPMLLANPHSEYC